MRLRWRIGDVQSEMTAGLTGRQEMGRHCLPIPARAAAILLLRLPTDSRYRRPKHPLARLLCSNGSLDHRHRPPNADELHLRHRDHHHHY